MAFINNCKGPESEAEATKSTSTSWPRVLGWKLEALEAPGTSPAVNGRSCVMIVYLMLSEIFSRRLATVRDVFRSVSKCLVPGGTG